MASAAPACPAWRLAEAWYDPTIAEEPYRRYQTGFLKKNVDASPTASNVIIGFNTPTQKQEIWCTIMESYHGARQLEKVQRAFMADHLVKWTPAMTRGMCVFARMGLYLALANLTEGFLREDAKFLGAR